MKPRLCISSWRAFASTHPLTFPSTSPREALLACPSFPPCNPFLSPWIPPSLLYALALISLFLAKVRLSFTLTLSPLTIWLFGLTALFLFFLAKVALAYLPTAFSEALRPLFPFQQAHYAQVFLLKPAPFCKFFAGLGSTNNSATSLLLSSYQTVALSSPLYHLLHLSLLPQSLWQELSSLSSYSIRLQWVPGHSFLSGNDTPDELARRRSLLSPSAIPCSLSPLISRIHSCLFSD